MNITKKITFKINKVKVGVIYLVRSKWLNFFGKNIRVLSISETLEKILVDKISVSRFGDGEMRLICGQSIEFQEYTPQLQERLIEVINSTTKGHLVCLPDVFLSLNQYKSRASYFWKNHLKEYYTCWLKYTNRLAIFGNAFITRPYITYKNYKQSADWFFRLKEIWNDREVVIVEGTMSRLGVGNDLFNNCRSIERILCAPIDAFASYGKILTAVRMCESTKLILVALGPTATVLCHDLNTFGYQSLDIGHVDIEYEWFLMKAEWKVEIPNKHTNEATNLLPENNNLDQVYLSQIIQSLA